VPDRLLHGTKPARPGSRVILGQSGTVTGQVT
jgi:hypothetical protein